MMKVYWTEDDVRNVESADELQVVIGEVLNLGEPTMLFMEHESGRTLVLGLGARESVLTFVENGGESFHSVGDLSRVGTLKFMCRDQLDDFMAEMAIPESEAIRAGHAFANSGKKPTNVSWEADW